MIDLRNMEEERRRTLAELRDAFRLAEDRKDETKVVFQSTFITVTTKSSDFCIGFTPVLQSGSGFEKYESFMLKYNPHMNLVQCPHMTLPNIPVDLQSAVEKMSCPCVAKYGRRGVFLVIHDLLYRHVRRAFEAWGKQVDMYNDNAKNISDIVFREDDVVADSPSAGEPSTVYTMHQMKIWLDDFKQCVGKKLQRRALRIREG
ncbi:hypothetical protein EGW08_023634 [Elysia chlorotica]|uniref:Uncharacterized protein n=1 Tax=Elysia chlorotica TaxID=188477 RepID=A0A3S1BJC4_ELYCH|nr:hypothetical protein EGW08_023634 [Elysia chlorotica]